MSPATTRSKTKAAAAAGENKSKDQPDPSNVRKKLLPSASKEGNDSLGGKEELVDEGKNDVLSETREDTPFPASQESVLSFKSYDTRSSDKTPPYAIWDTPPSKRRQDAHGDVVVKDLAIGFRSALDAYIEQEAMRFKKGEGEDKEVDIGEGSNA